ncbi:MAG: response regulator [Campylobacterales bacterium]|nr:response regulator [Campylobacterales bacterium]
MKSLDLLKQLTVLYVDDDLEARQRLEKILNYYFKKVYIAKSAKEALEIYKTGRINILLVDYDMPVTNGYEFLLEIRKEDSLIPAAIISSYDDKEKLFNAMKLELVDYLVKPYDTDELKKLFRMCLDWMERKGLLEVALGEDVTYSFVTKKIKVGKIEKSLTPSELKIFEHLLRNEGRVVYYDELISLIGEESTQRSLISQMSKLKKKLYVDIIVNLKDLGYKIEIK